MGPSLSRAATERLPSIPTISLRSRDTSAPPGTSEWYGGPRDGNGSRVSPRQQQRKTPSMTQHVCPKKQQAVSRPVASGLGTYSSRCRGHSTPLCNIPLRCDSSALLPWREVGRTAPDSGGQTLVMSPGPPQQRLPASMQNGTEIDPGMSQHSPLPGEQQNSLHGVQGTQVRLSRAPLPARCFVVPRVSPGDTSELRAGSAASGGGTAKYPVYDTARLPQKAASGVVARGVGARHPTTVGAGATARPFATFRSAATAVRAGKHACGEIGAAHGGCGRAASRLEARGATARRARRDADRLDRTLNVAAFSPRETAVLLPIP
jgi:hypothetical protein